MEAMDKSVLSTECEPEGAQLAPRDQHHAGDVQEVPGKAAAAGPHQVAAPGEVESGQGQDRQRSQEDQHGRRAWGPGQESRQGGQGAVYTQPSLEIWRF